MVGLSVVLENQKTGGGKGGDVINKTMLITGNVNNNSSSKSFSSVSSASRRNLSLSFFPSSPSFLDQCFLCRKKLLPGKDIYMYKGDKGFCSVECRCRQIFMDEEESLKKENCSLAAMKPKKTTSTSSSSSSSSSSRSPSSSGNSHHHGKGTRNRTGGFAY